MNLTNIVATQGLRVRLLRTSQRRSWRMRDGCLRLLEKKSKSPEAISQITAVNFGTELKARWLFRRCERANH